MSNNKSNLHFTIPMLISASAWVAGQSFSAMSKPTALNIEGRLNIEGTAQVSERFNISDTAKKLFSGKSNSGIAVVITTKLQTRTQS